jgi:hypothetical protein
MMKPLLPALFALQRVPTYRRTMMGKVTKGVKNMSFVKDTRPMTDIRIIKQEAVPKSGSFEVRFPDGRESKFFYFDDVPGRRMRRDAQQRAGAGVRQGICAG